MDSIRHDDTSLKGANGEPPLLTSSGSWRGPGPGPHRPRAAVVSTEDQAGQSLDQLNGFGVVLLQAHEELQVLTRGEGFQRIDPELNQWIAATGIQACRISPVCTPVRH